MWNRRFIKYVCASTVSTRVESSVCYVCLSLVCDAQLQALQRRKSELHRCIAEEAQTRAQQDLADKLHLTAAQQNLKAEMADQEEILREAQSHYLQQLSMNRHLEVRLPPPLPSLCARSRHK